MLRFRIRDLVAEKEIKELKREIKLLKREIKALKKDLNYKIALTTPDNKRELLLKQLYFEKMGKILNLDNPKNLNEKIQWMKLYKTNPERSLYADKYRVRQLVAKEIGEQYLIHMLGVYDNPEDIDFELLPNRFVIKVNHGCKYNIIVRDKTTINKDDIMLKLRRWLNEDYSFIGGFEMHYSGIERKIIIEEYLEDSNGELNDYKFYCFKDHVETVMACYGRGKGRTKFYSFDRNWELKRTNIAGVEAPEGFTLPKPENLDKMFEIAKQLSVMTREPFVRVDLYNVDGKIYFGELTLTPAAGFDCNRLSNIDLMYGERVSL